MDPPETFDAVEVGTTATVGQYEVTAEEIVGFAEQYDPQPFHVDEAAAADTPFGGLIASGWHTAAMTQRMVVDNFLAGAGVVGSPGIDDLRWRRPVRPGDTLSVELEITDTDPWDEDRGLVRVRVRTLDAEGTVVMTMDVLILFQRA